MKDILAVCAMAVEAQAMPKMWRVVESGPGFAAARAATRKAIQDRRPDLVISAGTCGALDPQLHLADVLVVARIQSPLGQFHTISPSGVVLHSQDAVAVTATDKRELFRTGAVIVDMEAAAVAAVCLEAGIPFACVKAVSDLASEDLPLDFNHYRNAAGGFENSRIAFAGIIKGKIFALMRLARQSSLAAKQLGAHIESSLA